MNSKRFTISTAIVVVLLFSLCHGQLTFQSPLALQDLTFTAWQFMFLGDSDRVNVTGRIVVSDPLHACHYDDIKNKDSFEGNIVIVGKDDHIGRACSPATKFRNVQKAKGAAVVLLLKRDEYNPLAASYYLDTHGVDIGGVEAQTTESDENGYNLLLKYASDENQVVLATLQGEDPNTYSSYYIAFSILTGLFALINIYFGVDKLRKFVIENNGFKASLPQVILSMEIASNVLRIILCLEPDTGVGRGLIDFGSVNFLQSGSLPWSFTSTLMIAFYWDQSLRQYGEKHTTSWNVFSLERWKIPLIIICALMVVGDLVRCTVLSLYMGSRDIAIGIFVFFGICALGIAVYFSTSGYKVLQWAKSTSAQSNKRDALSRMTQFIVANAVGLFWIVVSLVVMSASTSGFFYGYIPLFFGLNFVSFVQISLFQPQAHFGSSTSGGQTNNSSGKKSEFNLQDGWATQSQYSAQETTTTATGTEAEGTELV
jgi:hypothetical protein